MSDEELLRGMRELADKGELVKTGWLGFRAMADRVLAQSESPEEFARWTFWAGARCVFDALEQLDIVKKDEAGRLAKLKAELGADPFCHPPKPSTEH